MKIWFYFLCLTSLAWSSIASEGDVDPWDGGNFNLSDSFRLADSFDPSIYHFEFDSFMVPTQQKISDPEQDEVSVVAAEKKPKQRSALSQKTIESMIAHRQRNLPNIYKLLNCIKTMSLCDYAKLKEEVTSYRRQIYSLTKACLNYGFIESPRLGYWKLTDYGRDALTKLTEAGYDQIVQVVPTDEDRSQLRRSRSDEDLFDDADVNPGAKKRHSPDDEELVSSSEGYDEEEELFLVNKWDDMPEQLQNFLLRILESKVLPNILADEKIMAMIIEGEMLKNLKNIVGMQFIYMTGVAIDSQLDAYLRKYIRLKFEK